MAMKLNCACTFVRHSIVGTADEHLSEWTASTDQRREWISGFSGSAGTAIIARKSQDGNDGVKGDASAWLFVDNRYWIQAEGQTSKELWEVVRVVPKDSPGITSPWEWCKKVCSGSGGGT
jgi:Xaa-Pro aminopeptidase